MADLNMVFQSTEVGDIPVDWELTHLGDVFEVQQGKALSPAARSGISPRPFLRTANVLWGRLDLNVLDRMDFTDGEAEKLSLKPGDLLVCEGGEIGRTAIWKGAVGGCLYQNHIHRLRAKKSDISPDFVMYWMQAAFLHLRLYGGVGNRTTIPNLSGARLKSLHIPLPPVPEQRAIAAVLSKIQASVEVQDKIIATLKELKAATMAKLFREGLRGGPLKQTEIGDIPKSWDVVNMGSITEKMNYGTSVRCVVERSGRPVLRIPNIIDESVNVSDLKWTSLPDHEASKLALEVGDLLFVRTNGNRQYTGRCAVYMGEPEGALFASYLIRVRLTKGRLLPAFAQAYLSSLGRAQITSRAHPASDGKYNIDTGVLKDVVLPVPSLTEQERIVEILKKIDCRLTNATDEAGRTRALFSSMLHLLMTGEIRLPGFGCKPNLDSPWFKPEDVWEFVGRLVRKFDPERVILFGTRAWGTPRRDSDVDLLVVMEFAGRPVDMAVRIGAECDDRFPMDLIVRRPAEVQRRIAMGDPFFNQILRDGLVLHERAA